MQLTPDFTLEEFISIKDNGVPSKEDIHNLTSLANRLQVVRDFLRKPIKINSGWRSPEYNRSVGGAGNSQHLYGKAADIVVVGMSPIDVYNFLHNWTGGLGKYTTFTHVDIRDGKARW
jgi:uncharacterized protein YcbK (DUF882 family)